MMREIEEVLNKVRATSEHQPIFLQAIQEVFESIEPAVSRVSPRYVLTPVRVQAPVPCLPT